MKKYYVRICKDYEGELDLSILQLYSEDDIKEEYLAIDYIDEDDLPNLTMEDMQVIADRNNEKLVEIDTTPYSIKSLA